MFRTRLWSVVALYLTLNAVEGMDNPCVTAVNENAAWLEEDGSLRFSCRFQDAGLVGQDSESTVLGGGVPDTENHENTTCRYSHTSRKVLCKDSIDFNFLKRLPNKQVKTLTVDSYNIRETVKNKRRKGFRKSCLQKLAGELVLRDIHVELNTILTVSRVSTKKSVVKGEVFSNKIIKIGWKCEGEVILNDDDSAEVNVDSDESENGWNLQGTVDLTGDLGSFRGNLTYKDGVTPSVPFKGTFDVNVTVDERVIYGVLEAMDINVQGYFLGRETNYLKTEVTIPRGAFSQMTIENLVFKDSYFCGDFHSDSFEGINRLQTIKFLRSKMELMPEYGSIFRGSTLKAIYIENCNTPSIETGNNCNLHRLQLLSFKGSGFLEFSNSSFCWLYCSNLTFLSFHDANLKLVGNDSILQPVTNTLRYLDISYSTLTQEPNVRQFLSGTRITHLSLAGLQLKRVPAAALEMVNSTLKYLSLRKNNFEKIPGENMLTPILSFPKMLKLRALDLGGCHINYIEKKAFDLLENLEILDLSHNNIVNLQDGWVGMKPNILYLNLSYNGFATRASAINLLDVKEPFDLSNFENLKTLDLSNSNFWKTKRLIVSLNSNLRYVSLCKCGLKRLNDSTFEAMENVEEMDLSGNPCLGKTISMDQFRRMRSLRKLRLTHNGIMNLTLGCVTAEKTWKHLEYIDLSNNYIKMIYPEFFKAMPNVKIVRLSHNSISYWPKNLAKFLPSLRGVFLDNNKIESFKSETIGDFTGLDEVSLGNNPFVCGRFVLDFLSVFRNENAEYYLCPEFLKEPIPRKHLEIKNDFVLNRESRTKLYLFRIGCAKIKDWAANEYQCYSPSLRKVVPFVHVNDGFDEFRDNIDSDYFDAISLIVTSTSLFCFFLGFIWWKWWNLRLFASMIKTAAFNSFTEIQEYESIEFEYDAFVSYTYSDRQWVTDNLIPNLERLEDVKICLHERDFQVGLSILENIAISIDKSKCVILVISQAFVKSQWCQFEMHLAYHRLLESRRDHMILILLENIPRNIRPKTLQYLMMTTTYIHWPRDAENVKDIEIFWNRLFKALKQINPIN